MLAILPSAFKLIYGFKLMLYININGRTSSSAVAYATLHNNKQSDNEPNSLIQLFSFLCVFKLYQLRNQQTSYIYVCVWVYVRCVSVRLCAYIQYMYVCMCPYVCVCVCTVCMYVYICAYGCVYTVFMYVYVNVYAHACVYSMYVCVCAVYTLCMYTCTLMCICVYVPAFTAIFNLRVGKALPSKMNCP